MKKFLILTFIILITTLSAYAQEEKLTIVDLGQVGKVTPLKNLESIKKDNEEFHQKVIEPMKENLQKALHQAVIQRQDEFKELLSSADFSFHTSLPRYYGKPKTTVKYIEDAKSLPLVRRKILFFACENIIRPYHFKDVSAAYCLSYNNLEDIKNWTAKYKVNFFVQPLVDDDTCHFFGIEAYPATLTIKGDGKFEVTYFQENL